MKANLVWVIAGVLALLVIIPTSIYPQSMPPPPTQGAVVFTPEQLDQLLAPIALYPDPLLGQILMAATYPLEVVQAERWVMDPNNAALRGDALIAALQNQDWDPSVKSLLPFPQILQMMNDRLDWMQQLGDAFLGQQAQVMDSVQRLRHRAQAAGTLAPNAQQTVTPLGQAIVVEPANPGVIYVPVYDPTVVYGVWPYPDYPPVYFAPPPDYDFGSALVSTIGFGLGVVIVQSFWGWDDWDWNHHRVHIDVDRFNRISGDRPRLKADTWVHDPYHRRGVAYRDPQTRAQFGKHQPGAPDTRRDFRGYDHGADVAQPVTRPGGGTPRAPTTRELQPVAPNHPTVREPQSNGARGAREMPVRPTVQRTPPPAFEGYARGTEVRTHVDRGRASRQAIPRAGVTPRNVTRSRDALSPGSTGQQREGKPRQ